MIEHRVSEDRVTGHGWSDAQRAAIAEEIDRIVAHPAFKSSKNCLDLFRCLVDHALNGSEDGIKERTLGIEVFGRNANYDTNTDPVVRRTANEIRKRLAQCYQDPDRHYSLRVHLVRGNYHLEFDFEGKDRSADGIEAEEPQNLPEHPQDIAHFQAAPEIHYGKPATHYRKWIFSTAILLAVVCAGFFMYHSTHTRAPQYKVWKPLLDAKDTIIVCVSDQGSPIANNSTVGSVAASPATAGQNAAATSSDDSDQNTLIFRDALGGNSITTLISNFGKQASLRQSSGLVFQDFRQHPMVLIGGLNNPWMPMLLSNLRYTLHFDPQNRLVWVQDAKNPSNREWAGDSSLQGATAHTVDYAVVTRFFDQETRQWIIALSGLGSWGTEAAAELVADPNYARLIPENLSERGNFQIVLQVKVIRGSTGPFQVIALYTW